ncbi:TetR family transcriptional regulator, partial [Streptosporangium sp. NPDC001682]
MSTGSIPKPVAGVGGFVDDRLGAAPFLKRNLRKIFPDHWTFLLGEIPLYSFVVLLLTGVFLTFFFRPTMGEIVYDGSYGPLREALRLFAERGFHGASIRDLAEACGI